MVAAAAAEPFSPMEIRLLRTFLAVAETMNISAAARRLRVTQPAMSRQIRALESLVGHPLFVRSQKGLRLTATGVTLRDQASKAVAAVDEALRAARGTGTTAGTVVRLGYYGISIWANLLAPAVEMFSRRFPEVTLHMVEESSVHLAADLREGHLDVALLGSGEYERIAGGVSQVVCTVPAMVVVAANHRLAKKRVVALENLRTEEVVGFKHQDAPGRYRNFLTACRDAGFSPRVSYVASIFPELCMAVKQRMGIGIISAFARTVPHPGVVFIKLKPPGVPMELYTAHALNAAPAALELERLIAHAAKRAALQVGGQ